MNELIKKIDLENRDQVKQAYQVMKELRGHLKLIEFERHLNLMKIQGYELWSYDESGSIKGLMGLRVYTDLVRGAHLYIDDLVTLEGERSKGIGTKLLAHAEAMAKEKSITVIRLCAVIENESGLKFYHREGYLSRAFALVKKVNL